MARLAITYRPMTDFLRLHQSHKQFPAKVLSQTIKYAFDHLGEERHSLHFQERVDEKSVYVASANALVNGEMIEAYLDAEGKRLCKVVVRVHESGIRDDCVFVIALRERYGKVTVTFVTAYKNAATDEHRTLDRSQYYWGQISPSIYK